ncbi:MAG: hypothetical protein ACI8YI_001108 [Paracoccaceae bacterium]
MQLGDGLEFFKKNADPETVADLLGSCAIWIDPECYQMLPVWSPYTYRKAPLYKSNWEERQTNRGEPKFEGNVAASTAQNRYLGISGLNRDSRPNWSCCHIWGNDDPTFQNDFAEVNDPRYFTCPANMVLVPSPLKTFTDTIPEVKAALRFAASLLYDFWPENRPRPRLDEAGLFLPKVWRQRETISVAIIDDAIQLNLAKRVKKLTELHRHAGPNYPPEKTERVIEYWRAKLPETLFEAKGFEAVGHRKMNVE